MEKLTRTKKYAQLREELENDRETTIETPELSQYANKLNQIDSDQFERVEDKVISTPTREKEVVISRLFAVEEPTKDYLNEVVSEVKDYNKKQGLIQDEDTQANILKELRSSNSVRPFGNVEHIASMANEVFNDEEIANTDAIHEPLDIPFVEETDLNNTISLEIQKLLQASNDEAEVSFEESILNDLTIKSDNQEVEKNIEKKETNIFAEFHLNNPKSEDDEINNKVEEEIVYKLNDKEDKAKSSISVTEEEDELFDDDYDYDDKSTGGILNIILVVLILIMLVVLSVIIYLILMNKGLI
ncbi:MAG: hypothetical protein R3Y57_01495 [Erysipelotrichaceae bacterium]